MHSFYRYFVLFLFPVILFSACSQPPISLEQAIEDAARYFTGIIPEGTHAAVFAINAENPELGEYVRGKLSAALAEGAWLTVVRSDQAALHIISRELYSGIFGHISRETELFVGNYLGAHIIFSGLLTRSGQNWMLELEALNTEDAGITGQWSANNIQNDPHLTLFASSSTTALFSANDLPEIPLTDAERDALALTGFVHVEGGAFLMGSINGSGDERPVRMVAVSGFYMSKYPVTQEEWFAVMGTTVYQQRDRISDSWLMAGTGDKYPMYYVNWFEAVEYCNRRSLMEGLTPVYHVNGDIVTCDWNANGYRLPTEAEWEYAAKGGKKDTLIFEFSGSNNADEAAWHNRNSNDGTNPVGEKTANSLGLYDMSGNVWEWCWDWYKEYPNEVQRNPRGASEHEAVVRERVLRGGSWFNEPDNLRTAYRAYSLPFYRMSNIGFRLVRSRQN